jgi:hypothetical protein
MAALVLKSFNIVYLSTIVYKQNVVTTQKCVWGARNPHHNTLMLVTLYLQWNNMSALALILKRTRVITDKIWQASLEINKPKH